MLRTRERRRRTPHNSPSGTSTCSGHTPPLWGGVLDFKDGKQPLRFDSRINNARNNFYCEGMNIGSIGPGSTMENNRVGTLSDVTWQYGSGSAQ